MHRHVHDKLGSVYAFCGELDDLVAQPAGGLEAESDAKVPPKDNAGDKEIDGQPPRAMCEPPDAAASHEARVAHGSGAAASGLHWRVLAGALALVVATVAYAVSRGETPRREIRSIAVLPLQNLSNDSIQDYFADGMTDALITNLAQVQALRVISRTSVMSLGRFPEAIHHMERARVLDPLSASVASFLGRTLYRAGKYEEAIPHLTRAIELEPRNTLAYSRLMDTYEELGRHDQALAYHEREYQRTRSPAHLLRIARLQARMGKRDEARRTLERMDLSGGRAVEIAAVYAALGDNDEAFRWLGEAIEVRNGARLLFIKVDPPFASLRADLRWKDVLDRMNLPH